MTDKPKHKHTPSRRRKFLLWVIVPIVALIVGFVALSPQIDAWLATDPFTPQCHFEEDRLFVTGHPYQLTSINRGQYDPIDDVGNIKQISWAPDGTMLTVRDPHGDQEYEMILLSDDGEVIYTFEEQVESRPSWSYDSRVIEFSDNQYDYYINVETWERDTHYIPMQSLLRFYATKSPNERYRPYVMGRSGQESSWYIQDLEQDVGWLIGYWDENGPSEMFIGWSTNSKYMYFIVDDVLTQYSIETKQFTDLLELPYTPQYHNDVALSPNHDKLLIRAKEVSPIIIGLDTLDLNIIDSISSVGYAYWHPNNHEVVIINGISSNLDIEPEVLLYDTSDQTIHKLDVVSTDGVTVSPNGRYIRYFDGFNSSPPSHLNHKTHHLYDLESDTDVIFANFEYFNYVEWLSHAGKDYILVREALSNDTLKPFLTYLIDPEDLSKCKIGWTGYELSFQPLE